MNILDRLRTNKGTVSSKLSESLAEEVLDGKTGVLIEAVKLVSYSLNNKKEKHIRSGAAKIIECVAMKRPDLVAKQLDAVFPALEAAEPQTRWMMIRTIGFCAKHKPEIAKKAIPFAKAYLREKKEGLLCLASSADLFLADYGEISRSTAKEVFPVLLDSADNVIMNEHDWLLEAFMKITKHLTAEEKKTILSFAQEYKDHPRKKTRERVGKIERMCVEEKKSFS